MMMDKTLNDVLLPKIKELQQTMRRVMKHTKEMESCNESSEEQKEKWRQADDKIKSCYGTLGVAGVQDQEERKEIFKHNFSGSYCTMRDEDGERYGKLMEMQEVLSGLLQYYEKKSKKEAGQCYY